MNELWTIADRSALENAVRKFDLLDALVAIEGAGESVKTWCQSTVDDWSRRVQQRIEGFGPDAWLDALDETLTAELGFCADRTPTLDAEHTHLSAVMKCRRGIPELLSAVWIIVGRRAGIPIDPVDTPRGVVVRVGGVNGILVDPFSSGRVLVGQEMGGDVNMHALGASSAVALTEQILRKFLTNVTSVSDGKRVYRALRFLSALRPEDGAITVNLAKLTDYFGAHRLATDLYKRIVRLFPESGHAEIASNRLAEIEKTAHYIH